MPWFVDGHGDAFWVDDDKLMRQERQQSTQVGIPPGNAPPEGWTGPTNTS